VVRRSHAGKNQSENKLTTLPRKKKKKKKGKEKKKKKRGGGGKDIRKGKNKGQHNHDG